MSVGLDRARERMAEYLAQHGVKAGAAWPQGEREPLEGASASVSLRGCRAGPSGFQDYLGERYNQEAGRWEELYGRRAELTFGLDLYAPAQGGGAEIQQAFDRISAAFAAGGPQGLEIQEFSCGETSYDRGGRLLKRQVQVVCSAYLYAVAEPGGEFLDFEIRGEAGI